MSADTLLATVADGLRSGALVPYLGPEAVMLEPANAALPLAPEALAAFLSKRATVPSRIRRNPTAAAQYIENFRHRKTLKKLMLEAYALPAEPPGLYRLLARLAPPLVVDTGYDDAFMRAFPTALDGNADWAQIQGVSRAEVRDSWYLCYDRDGQGMAESATAAPRTLLYKPLGGVQPAGHFIVSDSDFVEVLTEIDIQTPIPEQVKARRAGRGVEGGIVHGGTDHGGHHVDVGHPVFRAGPVSVLRRARRAGGKDGGGDRPSRNFHGLRQGQQSRQGMGNRWRARVC